MKMLIDPENLPEPSKQMKIKVSRRGIFIRTAEAAEEKLRSRKGIPSYRIEDIAAFEPDRLDEICPVINSRAKISLENDIIYAAVSASVDPIPLFDVDSSALFIFNQFNGMQSLSEIIDKVSEHTGWDKKKTQKIVESMFLRLCEVRVCEPGNNV